MDSYLNKLCNARNGKKKIFPRGYIFLSYKYKPLPAIYFQAVCERTLQTLCSHHFAGLGSAPCVSLRLEAEGSILHPCAPEKNPRWLGYGLTYCSKSINHTMSFYFSCINASQLYFPLYIWNYLFTRIVKPPLYTH